MNRAVYSLLILIVAAVLSAGCYGGKLIKMPINAEQSSLQADSIKAQQSRILRILDELQKQINEERESRMRYEAQNGLTLGELEESVRILTSRLEDGTLQLTNRSGTPTNQPSRSGRGEGEAPRDTSAADSTALRTGMTDSQSADQLYRASYMDLTRGNYDLAAQGFKNYLVRYPHGAFLPEVHYYLGECYYAGERYLEAVGGFQYVVREFPESRLVPAAYLKSGLCYSRLEEKNLAERAFRELIEKYPDTEEAQQARDLLQQFGG